MTPKTKKDMRDENQGNSIYLMLIAVGTGVEEFNSSSPGPMQGISSQPRQIREGFLFLLQSNMSAVGPMITPEQCLHYPVLLSQKLGYNIIVIVEQQKVVRHEKEFCFFSCIIGSSVGLDANLFLFNGVQWF